MKIQNAIAPQGIIGALNVEPPSQLAYMRFVEKYQKGVDRQPITGLTWVMPNTISQEERTHMSAALISSHIRPLVDAWLDTGRNPDASESPGNRDMNKAVNVVMTVWEYLIESPPSLSPSLEPNGFVLSIADRASSPRASDYFQAQKVEAMRLLVGIMTSDWKERLCKCRHHLCGRYFLHAKLRRSYRYGTFCCREHHKNASANVCTKMKRQGAEGEMIQFAAMQLLKWRVKGPEWQEDRAKKKRLAGKLTNYITGAENDRIKQNLKACHEEVKMNWVTRHRQEIEKKRLELAAK